MTLLLVTINTSRLLLRPFTRDDVSKVFVMSREAPLRRWLPDQQYRDLEHADEVVSALAAHARRDPDPRTRPYVLGIEHVQTRSLIGHVGLSPARNSVEIGYAIEEQLQGRGFATEAVRAMSEWATTTLELPEVLGIVVSDNLASCRVLAKAGFVHRDEQKTTPNGTSTIAIYRFVQQLPRSRP